MSRFNEYARKADAYAKAVFEEYAAAESKLKAAESKRNAFPRKNGMGYEYVAKAARFEAEYQEAKFFFHDTDGNMYTANSYSEFKSKIQRYAPYLEY